MKIITQTERLTLRELTVDDAEFINEILNTPKFLQYIGDRQVRTADQAADFIENRYRQSYVDHGFGLYAVDLKDGTSIGMCALRPVGTTRWARSVASRTSVRATSPWPLRS